MMKDRQAWQLLLDYGAERARALGLTEEDVPRLIAEVRTEQRRARTTFKTENLSADELKAIMEGGMDARHDPLNSELGE